MGERRRQQPVGCGLPYQARTGRYRLHRTVCRLPHEQLLSDPRSSGVACRAALRSPGWGRHPRNAGSSAASCCNLVALYRYPIGAARAGRVRGGLPHDRSPRAERGSVPRPASFRISYSVFSISYSLVPQSSIFTLQSSILDCQSSILNPQSSISNPSDVRQPPPAASKKNRQPFPRLRNERVHLGTTCPGQSPHDPATTASRATCSYNECRAPRQRRWGKGSRSRTRSTSVGR